MREKLNRFMYGRYGLDSFGKFLLTAAIVFIGMSWFVKSRILEIVIYALLILSYYRILSRNTYKRALENQRYLEKTYKIRAFFGRKKNTFYQAKNYHIYKCPGCRQKIRIPRGKGKIEIRCPKCSTTFIKRS